MQLWKKYPRILIGFCGTLSNKSEIESFLIYPSLFLSIYNSKKSRCKLTKKEKTIVLFNHCIIRSFVPCPKTHSVEACVVGRFPSPPPPLFFLGGWGNWVDRLCKPISEGGGGGAAPTRPHTTLEKNNWTHYPQYSYALQLIHVLLPSKML